MTEVKLKFKIPRGIVRKDEIETLHWVTRIIRLDRAVDIQQHRLGITKMQLELEDTKKFENMLQDKIQELEIELRLERKKFF